MRNNKMVRCSGGCGRTQDVIINPKGSDGFTATRPWWCPTCQEKEDKRKAKAGVSHPVPEAKAKPDAGFTVRPRRVSSVASPAIQRQDGHTVSKPPGSEQVPSGESAASA